MADEIAHFFEILEDLEHVIRLENKDAGASESTSYFLFPYLSSLLPHPRSCSTRLGTGSSSSSSSSHEPWRVIPDLAAKAVRQSKSVSHSRPSRHT